MYHAGMLRFSFQTVPPARVLALCMVFAAAPVTAAFESADMGERKPFSSLVTFMPDGSGRRSLNDYPGQVLVVNFWASWCPPCLAEMPTLQSLAARLKDRPFKVLAVNVGDRPTKVRQLATLWGNDIEFLLDGDGKQARAWGVRFYPATFILDSHGRIIRRVRGEMDWNSAEAIGWIEPLLADPGQ